MCLLARIDGTIDELTILRSHSRSPMGIPSVQTHVISPFIHLGTSRHQLKRCIVRSRFLQIATIAGTLLQNFDVLWRVVVPAPS